MVIFGKGWFCYLYADAYIDMTLQVRTKIEREFNWTWQLGYVEVDVDFIWEK